MSKSFRHQNTWQLLHATQHMEREWISTKVQSEMFGQFERCYQDYQRRNEAGNYCKDYWLGQQFNNDMILDRFF